MNRVRNIRIEIWKYKAVKCFEIYTVKVSTLKLIVICTKLVLRSMQLEGNITLATFDFNKHLTSHVASCNIGEYLAKSTLKTAN